MGITNDYIRRVSDRINAVVRDVAAGKVVDRLPATGFDCDSCTIIEAAQRLGLILYAAHGRRPSVYLIGVWHDTAHRDDCRDPQTPAGHLLAHLLDRRLLTPEDIILVEGLEVGESFDVDGVHSARLEESYLLGNCARLRASGVAVTGMDDAELMRRHDELLVRASEEQRRGDERRTWSLFDRAARVSILRDLRYALRLIADGRRAFVFIGLTHVAGGVLTEKLERAGRQYVALLERRRNPPGGH